jgi:hypothetical protein
MVNTIVSLSRLLIFGAFVLMLSTTPAFAYLDPGTGSLILQSILGLLVGALVGFKLFWNKIKGFITPRTAGNDRDSEPTPKRSDHSRLS